MHRDYFYKNIETFIKIFTDRIEFVNPASFPFENITFDEIKKTKLSKRRNPLVAEFFESLLLMEKEGRGLSRIEGGMKEHGLPQPIFEASPKTFMVIIKNSPYKRIVNFGFLNERQKILIEYMGKLKGQTISRGDYINLLNLNKVQTASLTASRVY